MKKGLIIFLMLLTLAALPALANSQGLFGSLWPGKGQSSACGSCDPCAPRLCGPPIFYVGWMDTHSASLHFNATSGGGQHWPLAGIWLGLADSINLNRNWGLDFDGWLLIPMNSRGNESETLETSTPVTVFTGLPPLYYRVDQVVSTTTLVRTWETKPDWWYVDAAATYGISDAFKVLGGFRYEHFSTSFRNPHSVFGLITTPNDTADVTVNNYLPFVGLQSGVGGSTSKISIKVIGFPMAFADVTFGETGMFGVNSRVQSKGGWDKGYFLEIFAEATTNFSANMGVGAFVTWNMMHAQGNLKTDILPVIGSIDSPETVFNRDHYTVGANMTLNFGLPF
jgi:hypothetical protein